MPERSTHAGGRRQGPRTAPPGQGARQGAAMPEWPGRQASMEDHMFKSIATLGAAVALVASVASAQAGWNNSPQLNALNPNALNPNAFNSNALNPNALNPNALTPNGLTGNSLSSNGQGPQGSSINGNGPGAGFAVDWVELPDGTVVGR